MKSELYLNSSQTHWVTQKREHSELCRDVLVWESSNQSIPYILPVTQK